MPKKFSGENTKAIAARERKKQLKDDAQRNKEKVIENDQLNDEHKFSARKQQKREAAEKKKQQILQRKAEAKELLENEIKEISEITVKKVTRAQINSRVSAPVKSKKPVDNIIPQLDAPVLENFNRLQIGEETATSVEEAIAILTEKEVDRHPEKRLKAAYAAFENKRLQEIKKNVNSLRLSQMKQMIFKEWQKSSENPLNNQ